MSALLVLSDPDDAGDVIASKLLAAFSSLRRVEVDPTQARMLTGKGWKYGVENCSVEYLLSLSLM